MKKVLIALLVLAGLAVAVFFYLRDRKLTDFEPQLIEKISGLVHDATNGLYQLDISSLEVDVLNARVTLFNARLSPDSSVLARLDSLRRAPNEVFFLEVDRLNIEGIDPSLLVETSVIDLDTLLITKPRIRIYHTHREYNDALPVDTTPIDQLILKDMDRIKLNRLLIQDADLEHYNVTQDKKMAIQKVTVDIQDILIDSASVLDTTRILFAKDAQVRFEDYVYSTPDSVYNIMVGGVFISAAKKDLELSNVALKPRVSRQQFVKQQKEVKELYTLNFKKVVLNEINWWSLLNDQILFAESAELSNGNLEVYCNRSLPPFSGSKIGNYPHQALMKLPIDLHIKEMTISNFDIEYEEYNPNSKKAGVLSFSNASGKLTNVTNNIAIIERNPLMVANARASLMGKAAIQATFTFNLARHKEGIFSVDMSMGKMDGTTLNTVTEPLGMFSVKSLNIQSINSRINGSDYRGNGRVTILYDDLKIVPLKQDDEEGLKERGFLGFLANTFVVKSDNVKGDKQRITNPVYTRETSKSFFALIWKTLLTGILEAVGAPPALAKPKED